MKATRGLAWLAALIIATSAVAEAKEPRFVTHGTSHTHTKNRKNRRKSQLLLFLCLLPAVLLHPSGHLCPVMAFTVRTSIATVPSLASLCNNTL